MSYYRNGTPLQCDVSGYHITEMVHHSNVYICDIPFTVCLRRNIRIYRVCTTLWCSVTYSIVLYILGFTFCCLRETAGEVFCYIPFHCMHAIRSCCFVIWYHIIIALLLHQHCQARECPGMTAMHIAVVPTYQPTE